MGRLAIAVTVAATLLAACSSLGGEQAETAAPASTTVTTEAPTTTKAPTTTTPTGSEIGKTKLYNGDEGGYKTKAKIAVLDYSD
jgi:ABC-type glycerol-3-phosphate transport system substrate-binding protein